MEKLVSADLANNTLCILEYTTNNRKMLSFKTDPFDAKIVSHTYTDIGKIVFDRPITKIGEKAFYWRFSLTSVTIPDSVTTIGTSAFQKCINLKEFKGKFAADGGRCLIVDNTIIAYVEASGTTYTIPDNVTTIGDRAFCNCESLTSVTIPNSVKTIGEGAFSGCIRLTSITIPHCVTMIGDYAFNYCHSLTSVIIPDSVTTIRDGVFSGCRNLTCVTIPDGVTRIGDFAFENCSSLTSVTIPDSVTRIGEKVFRYCISLITVTIGNSVTTIGDMAFCGCKTLTEFKGRFASDDGRCLIIYGVLNSFAPAELSEYNIPNSVTAIGDGAFRGCDSLTSVTISNRVVSIGDGAFYGCKSLSNVTIGNSVRVIFDRAFLCCNIDTIVCYPKVPPKIYKTFGVINKIVVPTGYEEAYANSDWGRYLE